jgi:hypothetical protein
VANRSTDMNRLREASRYLDCSSGVLGCEFSAFKHTLGYILLHKYQVFYSEAQQQTIVNIFLESSDAYITE